MYDTDFKKNYFSLVISFQTLSDVQLSRPLLSGRASRTKLSPFQFYRQSAPEPLPIGNNSLKSFLAHSSAKPFLTHNTFIVFVAPFNLSLIKQRSRKPPFKACVNFKTVRNKHSNAIHIHSVFLVCFTYCIRLVGQTFFFPHRIALNQPV